MVTLNLSIFLFLSIIDFLLITVTIIHTMIITKTPLTTPTSMPPAHEALLVDVQDWDVVAGVPVVIVTMHTMILII